MPPGNSPGNPKKNFKIWFSPRSRKVRCVVEKPSQVAVPESRTSEGGNLTQPFSASAHRGDLAVFNFASSSQDSSSSCSQISKNGKRKKKVIKKTAVSRKNSFAIGAARKQKVETVRKNRLEAINQQWAIMEEPESLKDKEEADVEKSKRSSKRVSFHNPAVSAKLQSEEPGVSSEIVSTVAENSTQVNSVLTDRTQAEPSGGVALPLKPSPQSCGSHRTPHQDKADEKIATLETTPKRRGASPGKRRKSQMSPVVLYPAASRSPACRRSSGGCGKEPAESPSPGCKSPSNMVTTGRRPPPGSPAVMKRNHKGETPLHVASIKVEIHFSTFH